MSRISVDDIIEIEDKIQGVTVLLTGLLFSDEAGEVKYHKRSYEALNIVLYSALNDLEQLKKDVDDC